VSRKAQEHSHAHPAVDGADGLVTAEKIGKSFAPGSGVKQPAETGNALDEKSDHDEQVKQPLDDIEPDYPYLVIHLRAFFLSR
jgi:hypothetical protein